MSDLPRVTEILKPYVDYSMIASDVLDAASDRGIRVHNYCAAYAKGIYSEPMDADCHGYLESFLIWFNKYVAEVLAVEIELVSPFGYIGHADLIVRLKDKRVPLIDLKTPLTGSKTWKAQIAAYLHEAAKPPYHAEIAGTLQLNSNGRTPRMAWLEDDGMAFQAFLGSLNAFRYFRK
jgi:hypothetical protein